MRGRPFQRRLNSSAWTDGKEHPMDSKKYIGMDVHQASISIAVMDATGKVVGESIIETKATTIGEFTRGLKGPLWRAFEEGTSAAWLYDLLKPRVAKVIVCDPRKNALLNAGNKNDRVDARKPARTPSRVVSRTRKSGRAENLPRARPTPACSFSRSSRSTADTQSPA